MFPKRAPVSANEGYESHNYVELDDYFIRNQLLERVGPRLQGNRISETGALFVRLDLPN